MSPTMHPLKRAKRMQPFGGPSVWLEFGPLARLTSSINLGQGAPGWDSPAFVKAGVTNAVNAGQFSQYARSAGAPLLVTQIAKTYTSKVVPQDSDGAPLAKISPMTQILVTNGASHAIELTCTALLNEGDEVLMFQPAFDLYTAAVKLACAKPVYSPLLLRRRRTERESTNEATPSKADVKADDDQGNRLSSTSEIEIDFSDFRSKISSRTRLVILNTPHNPTGKVFTREELTKIAEILDEEAPDCMVLSDEVYEHMTYDSGSEHIAFASISPSAHKRTLSVYSAGKTFSATGLKIGWVIGPTSAISDMQVLQQYTVFAVSHVNQVGIAHALQAAERPYKDHTCYYAWLREMYARKREICERMLVEGGLHPISPQGAFYMCAYVPSGHPCRQTKGLPQFVQALIDERKLNIDVATLHKTDYNIARSLTVDFRVAAIPVSAFCPDGDGSDGETEGSLLRFAFCHPDSVLEEAGERLRKHLK